MPSSRLSAVLKLMVEVKYSKQPMKYARKGVETGRAGLVRKDGRVPPDPNPRAG